MSIAQSVTRTSKANSVLATPSDLPAEAVAAVSQQLRCLLADVLVLYLKIKNFHWHMSGRHFRDYHLLLEEQADQVFAMIDDLAERARKMGGTTLRSIGDIARHQRLPDNDDDFVPPPEMFWSNCCPTISTSLALLRDAHTVCGNHNDVATASLIENWIDETERRTWFLFEMASFH